MRALPEFSTLRAATWQEAAAALAEDPRARAMAGGTDLVPNLRRGLRATPVLVELGRLPGYDALERRPNGTLVLGAGITLARLARDAVIGAHAPALAEAARSVAGPAHRSAATLGGNLCQDTRCVFYNQGEWWRTANSFCLKERGTRCHVAPQGERCHAAFCSDLAPVLLVLQAEVEIASPRGTRWQPLDALYREDGADHLALAEGELVSRVRIPAAAGVRCAFAKVRVRGGIDFALAAVAVAASFDGGKVRALRIAVSGTNSAPVRVEGLDALCGRGVDADLLEQASRLLQKQVTPMRTTAMPANYRRQAAAALAQRLLRGLHEGATHGV